LRDVFNNWLFEYVTIWLFTYHVSVSKSYPLLNFIHRLINIFLQISILNYSVRNESRPVCRPFIDHSPNVASAFGLSILWLSILFLSNVYFQILYILYIYILIFNTKKILTMLITFYWYLRAWFSAHITKYSFVSC
jgi:hypothetical protein